VTAGFLTSLVVILARAPVIFFKITLHYFFAIESQFFSFVEPSFLLEAWEDWVSSAGIKKKYLVNSPLSTYKYISSHTKCRFDSVQLLPVRI
jgi:hypothetical protein